TGTALAFVQPKLPAKLPPAGEPGAGVPESLALARVLVFLPEAPAPTSVVHLALRGGGDLVERAAGREVWMSRDGWYPAIGWPERATFDLTYDVPPGLELGSTGRVASRVEGRERLLAGYGATDPVRDAGFVVGNLTAR